MTNEATSAFKIRVVAKVTGHVFNVSVCADSYEAAIAQLKREYSAKKFTVGPTEA